MFASNRTLNWLLLVALTSVGSLMAQGKKRFSGPQPGEKLPSFKVLRVVDLETTKEIEVKPNAKKPALVVFLHQVNEPAIWLMITLEWFAAKQRNLNIYYVVLTDDISKTEPIVKRWSRRPFFAKAIWEISVDGSEGLVTMDSIETSS